MFLVPFEVLTLILKKVSKKQDLLQCQLVSKSWYQISVGLLYFNIDLLCDDKEEETERLFVRTISNSSTLGHYVKYIETSILFGIDERHLLDALALNCPNILRMNSNDQNESFWTRISYASTQGHFSQLQYLPAVSDCENLGAYMNAVLHFKSSLTTLFIKDDDSLYGDDLEDLEIYSTLKNQIDEFQNLDDLTVHYQSNKGLSNLDDLIEKCRHLVVLDIDLQPTSEDIHQQITPVVPLCNPRSDISSLLCNWESIRYESQLNYLMQKFPRLQHLEVSFDPEFAMPISSVHCNFNTLAKFLLYVITKIQKFSLNMGINNHDLPNLWIKLMNGNDVFKNLTLHLQSLYSDYPICCFEMTDKKSPTIQYSSSHGEIDAVNTSFFTKVGNRIQSLTIFKTEFTRGNTNLLNMFDSIFKFAIISCSSLQELTLHRPPKDLELDDDRLKRNSTVKSLQVFQLTRPEESLGFLEYFSNLKQLLLSHDHDLLPHTFGLIAIMVPHTSLDLLTWANVPRHDGEKLEMFIKLITNTGLTFYRAENNNLFKMTKKNYKKRSRGKFRFEIKCQKLKAFKVIVNQNSLSPQVFKWVFS